MEFLAQANVIEVSPLTAGGSIALIVALVAAFGKGMAKLLDYVRVSQDLYISHLERQAAEERAERAAMHKQCAEERREMLEEVRGLFAPKT